MRRWKRIQWKPRSRALVLCGICFVLLAVIHGVDYFLYGVAVHAIGPAFPRIGGSQLLVATILLGISGVAMIWSGSRPAEPESPDREAGKPTDALEAGKAPDRGHPREETDAGRE